MPSYLQQVFTLLTTSPGNLVYHIILSFSVVGALQAGLSHWRNHEAIQGRRTNIGLGIILFAQLSLFASTALAWLHYLTPHAYIPPLDRAITLLSLIVIVWIWAFPGTSRLADTATSLMILLIVAGSVLTLNWWYMNNLAIEFNNSWPDTTSCMLGAIFSFGGILMIGLRKPNGWGIGVGMVLLLGAGFILHWFFPGTGDYSGVLRLAQITAFPLLLTLPQRYLVPGSRLVTPGQPSQPGLASESVTKIKPRYSTDPKVMQALLELASERSPEKAHRLITRLVSQIMLADLCLLISMENNSSLVVSCGFDLIREIPIDGFPLDLRSSPVMASALRRGKPLRLPASSTSPDIQGLCQALNMNRVGHLLVVPLWQPISTSSMGLILLSPYSNRSWTLEDQTNLTNFSSTIREILQRTQQLSTNDTELQQSQASLAASRNRVEQLDRDIEKLRTELAYSQEQNAYTSARAESLAAMLANREPQRADKVDGQYPASNNQERLSKLTTVTHELRQPMSSIVGYTELLLGESIGILGAMQRKFLERIKSSIERMNSLVDDMSNNTMMDRPLHTAVTVDLSHVIDEAIAQCAPQFREKNIAIRADLPDTLPQMQADNDALHQILFHLLQNAGITTPSGGEISLSVHIENQEHDPGYALIQVSDSGTGISPDDLPRVFSRLYRTDNANINGIGDNGVGLAIVKTLVEALGGRIWVDSELGNGARYSLLLPISNHEGHGGSD